MHTPTKMMKNSLLAAGLVLLASQHTHALAVPKGRQLGFNPLDIFDYGLKDIPFVGEGFEFLLDIPVIGDILEFTPGMNGIAGIPKQILQFPALPFRLLDSSVGQIPGVSIGFDFIKKVPIIGGGLEGGFFGVFEDVMFQSTMCPTSNEKLCSGSEAKHICDTSSDDFANSCTQCMPIKADDPSYCAKKSDFCDYMKAGSFVAETEKPKNKGFKIDTNKDQRVFENWMVTCEDFQLNYSENSKMLQAFRDNAVTVGGKDYKMMLAAACKGVWDALETECQKSSNFHSWKAQTCDAMQGPACDSCKDKISDLKKDNMCIA